MAERMKRAIALILIGLVAGCTSTTPTAKPVTSKSGASVTLSDAERSTVQQDMVAALPDVTNATFRTISASRRSDGTLDVCGYIDVTNGAGVKSGDKPFIGTLANGSFALSAMAGTKEEIVNVQTQCIKNRVYI
jgi:hypothetical protein